MLTAPSDVFSSVWEVAVVTRWISEQGECLTTPGLVWDAFHVWALQ